MQFLLNLKALHGVLLLILFQVEKHDSCVYDYVEILDGHYPDSPVIGKFCGYSLPPDIHSTGNKLLVKFVSDGSVQKPGFSAAYMKGYCCEIIIIICYFCQIRPLSF